MHGLIISFFFLFFMLNQRPDNICPLSYLLLWACLSPFSLTANCFGIDVTVCLWINDFSHKITAGIIFHTAFRKATISLIFNCTAPQWESWWEDAKSKSASKSIISNNSDYLTLVFLIWISADGELDISFSPRLLWSWFLVGRPVFKLCFKVTH